jgi:hypothetical protein
MNNTNTLKAFEAITEFVSNLHDIFEKQSKPLSLYNRLLEHVTIKSKDVMRKHVEIFDEYIRENKKYIMDEKLFLEIPNRIIYSKEKDIYLDIPYFLRKSDDKDIIRQYLLTIDSILHPEEANLKMLEESMEKLNTNTKEGELLSSIFNSTKEVMSQQDGNDFNPMTAIMGLMTSGALPKMFNEITQGMESGNLTPDKLMKTMGEVLNTVMPQKKEEPNEIKKEGIVELIEDKKMEEVD